MLVVVEVHGGGGCTGGCCSCSTGTYAAWSHILQLVLCGGTGGGSGGCSGRWWYWCVDVLVVVVEVVVGLVGADKVKQKVG